MRLGDVNISSINGQKGIFGQTNYAAAKAGFSASRKRWASKSIRCTGL